MTPYLDIDGDLRRISLSLRRRRLFIPLWKCKGLLITHKYLPSFFVTGYTCFNTKACWASERHAIWRLQGGHRMANQEHLDILKQGVKTWNQWRKEHPDIKPDLSGAIPNCLDLGHVDFSQTNLSQAYLGETDLTHAIFFKADLREADLTHAKLSSAEFDEANLTSAVLYGADLSDANLYGADLSGAILSDADLSRAKLVGTNFTDATLTNCKIYGIAAWNVELRGAKQDIFDPPVLAHQV
jgi:hypothetical protein